MKNKDYTIKTCLSGALVGQYGAIRLVPITYENINTLKPGDWIWDDKPIERKEHERSLNPETIYEPIGFRQIHILDIKDFGTIFNDKPFMLSDIHKGGYRWVRFEEGRFYMA